MGSKLSLPKNFEMLTDKTKAPKIDMNYCKSYDKYFMAVRIFLIFYILFENIYSL